jgi:ParB-like chromosome segregation protein Spo0J
MARLPERQIVAIEQLHPAAYNPRKDLKRGDPEYDHLANSIEAFGYIEPIVWNKRSGNVVGGHQRLKVLIERGESEAEVVVVDYDETTEQAANLALNKIRGDWDFPKLADLLISLDTGAFDLDLTGFSEGELKNIMGWTPGGRECQSARTRICWPRSVSRSTSRVTMTCASLRKSWGRRCR